MINHPFIDFLKTLSKDEVQKFGDFISSPYFNKKSRLMKLFNALIKNYPGFNDEWFNKKNLYQKLYPGKVYHDSTIRDMLSDLLQLSKEFLIVNNFNINNPEFLDILLSQCVSRNLKSQFFKSIDSAENILSQSRLDSKFFLSKYILESNKYNFNVLNSKFTKIEHVIEQFDEIKKCELYFLLYFILEFVSDYVKIFLFSMSYNIGQKVELYDEVMNNVDIEKIYQTLKGKTEYDFILELYLKLLYAFKYYTKDKFYKDYKSALTKISNVLSNNELTFHYSNLINYCVLRKSKSKDSLKYNLELFEIYKTVLKEGYFKDSTSAFLDKILYRNILFLALKLNEHEWVKYFISNYSSLLNNKVRKNMMYYSYVYLYYDLENYKKALNYLNKINLDYFIYKYDVYNIKVKIYYELKYYESALGLIHTYKQYIRNDKVLEYSMKAGHNNFLKYAEQLILNKLGKKNTDLVYLKRSIEKMDNVFQRKWLIEKILYNPANN